MSKAEAALAPGSAGDLFDWPLFGLQDDVRAALAKAAAQGVYAVLATLYGVIGGAPRGVGAQMVFVEDAAIGFLSGGCIEADLALHAQGVLAERKSRRVVYGEGGPVDVQLPCGSRIEVLLEPVPPHDPAVMRLVELAKARRPAVWLSDGDRRICIPADETPAPASPLFAAAALARASSADCGFVREPFAVFRAYAPPRRLVAVGGDPIALAVVKLAVEMGLETILIRPKGPTTCPIPGVRYVRSDTPAAIAACRLDPWTAIAVLTHDVEQEGAALIAALRTEAGYVGALGSRRRGPDRNARLEASGFSTAEIERLHAPIGLPIGGKSPWEIAVSIIAEIVRDMDDARRR